MEDHAASHYAKSEECIGAAKEHEAKADLLLRKIEKLSLEKQHALELAASYEKAVQVPEQKAESILALPSLSQKEQLMVQHLLEEAENNRAKAEGMIKLADECSVDLENTNILLELQRAKIREYRECDELELSKAELYEQKNIAQTVSTSSSTNQVKTISKEYTPNTADEIKCQKYREAKEKAEDYKNQANKYALFAKEWDRKAEQYKDNCDEIKSAETSPRGINDTKVKKSSSDVIDNVTVEEPDHIEDQHAVLDDVLDALCCVASSEARVCVNIRYLWRHYWHLEPCHVCVVTWPHFCELPNRKHPDQNILIDLEVGYSKLWTAWKHLFPDPKEQRRLQPFMLLLEISSSWKESMVENSQSNFVKENIDLDFFLLPVLFSF